MGLGHCLMEHIVLDDTGRIRNLGALDYRVPTTKDVRTSNLNYSPRWSKRWWHRPLLETSTEQNAHGEPANASVIDRTAPLIMTRDTAGTDQWCRADLLADLDRRCG